MVKCDYCGKDDALPFKCRYCGKLFCSEHRLPEFHDCVSIPIPVEFKKEMIIGKKTEREPERKYNYEDEEESETGIETVETYYVTVTPTGKVKPLKKGTALDFMVGVFAVFLAGLSYFIYNMNIILSLVLGLLFAIVYVVHEGAHYLAARKLGVEATYVLNPTWLLILAITLVLPFKFIFPGTIVIFSQNREALAKVSTAGPAANLVVSIIALALYMILPTWWLLFLMFFSSMIGIVNMIPLIGFDGEKIYNWNKKMWAMLTIGHIAIMIFSYLRVLIY